MDAWNAIVKRVSRLNMRQKILLALTVPLLFSVYLLSFAIYDASQNALNAHRNGRLLSVHPEWIEVVQKVQLEGWSTVNFLVDSSLENRKTMLLHRRLVDESYAAFQETLWPIRPGQNAAEITLIEGVDALKARFEYRHRVDKTIVSARDAIGYYGGIQAQLLESTKALSESVQSPLLAQELMGLSHLERVRYLAAQERAIMALSEAGDPMAIAMAEELVALGYQQGVHLNEFKRLASPAQLESLHLFMTPSLGSKITQLRRHLRGEVETLTQIDWVESNRLLGTRLALLAEVNAGVVWNLNGQFTRLSRSALGSVSFYLLSLMLLGLFVVATYFVTEDMAKADIQANSVDLEALRKRILSEEMGPVVLGLTHAVDEMNDSLSSLEEYASMILKSADGFTKASISLGEMEPRNLEGFEAFFEDIVDNLGGKGSGEVALSIPGYAMTLTELEHRRNRAAEGLADGLDGIQEAVDGVCEGVIQMERALLELSEPDVRRNGLEVTGPGVKAMIGKRMAKDKPTRPSESMAVKTQITSVS